jgi:hypothetical protein
VGDIAAGFINTYPELFVPLKEYYALGYPDRWDSVLQYVDPMIKSVEVPIEITGLPAEIDQQQHPYIYMTPPTGSAKYSYPSSSGIDFGQYTTYTTSTTATYKKETT